MQRMLSLFLLSMLLMSVPVHPAPARPQQVLPQTAAAPTLEQVRSGPAGAEPAPTAGSFCADAAPYTGLLSQVTLDSWSGWIRKLSGAEPMLVHNVWVTNTTRFSPALFDGRSPAYDFVREQVLGWYPAGQVEEHSYVYQGSTWKNLSLTIPGVQYPDEIVVLSAHLDSISSTPATAPGADDNATGVATLLEAARVLRANPLPRTLRLIWFTGEEQGLIGSRAYVESHPMTGIVGVFNIDMIGYDGDNDRCFELHVGGLPASDLIGRCLVQAVHASGVDLEIGYITTLAIGASDHASFWSKGIPALELGENFPEYTANVGCYGQDENPNYHKTSDIFANLSLAFSYDVARAGLAGTFALANSRYPAKFFLPLLQNGK